MLILSKNLVSEKISVSLLLKTLALSLSISWTLHIDSWNAKAPRAKLPKFSIIRYHNMHDLHHRHLYDHHHHQHQHDHWSVGRVVVVEVEWVSNTAVILHTHWVCRRGVGLISREYQVTTCHVTVFIPQTASSHVWLYKILPPYPPFWEVTILNCKIYAWVYSSPFWPCQHFCWSFDRQLTFWQ